MIESSRKMYQSLIFFVGDKIYIKVDKDSNPNYVRLIDEIAIKLLTSTLKTISIIIGSIIVYVGFPIYVFIFHNEIQFAVPVYVPFTDLNSTTGIIINVVQQGISVWIGVTGNIGIEIITCMLKNTVWACTVAICHSIDEISELLVKSKPNSSNIITSRFRNILVQVQDLDR